MSKAGVGAVVILVESLLRFIGVDFPEGSVSEAINGLVVFGGLVLLVVGQLQRKDLKYGLFRKG